MPKNRNAANVSNADLREFNNLWSQDPDMVAEDSPLDPSIEAPVDPRTYKVDKAPDKRIRSKHYGF